MGAVTSTMIILVTVPTSKFDFLTVDCNGFGVVILRLLGLPYVTLEHARVRVGGEVEGISMSG